MFIYKTAFSKIWEVQPDYTHCLNYKGIKTTNDNKYVDDITYIMHSDKIYSNVIRN